MQSRPLFASVRRNAILAAAISAALLSTNLPVGGEIVLNMRQVGQGIGVVDEPGASADAPSHGVYVKDSALAADKFELGKRMERLKEWHKSADVYQEILEKYQDRVVPILNNNDGDAIKYASVAVAVQERLARWPAEGLAVYRTKYEPAAQTILEQAGPNGLPTLHRVFSNYFVTDSAKQAGMRLMEIYRESGEFGAAARIGDRLLMHHPSVAGHAREGGNHYPAIAFQTALAFHLGGHADEAGKILADLKKRFPNELGVVAGRDVKLVEALEAQLQTTAASRTYSDTSHSWMTFGGGPTRGAINAGTGEPGAKVYSLEIPSPAKPPVPGNEGAMGLEAQHMRARMAAMNMAMEAPSGEMLAGIMPVVDRGELFFNDGMRIHAVHLQSGVPLAGWQQAYSQHNGQYQLPVKPPEKNAEPHRMMDAWAAQMMMTRGSASQHTLTLTDDAVLAVMGRPTPRIDPRFGRQMMAPGGSKLVCLDRATGRQRWIVDPADLPGNAGNAKNLSFSGAPLAVGDSVYLIARGSGGGGVEDCNVLCVDTHTGQYKWISYIASSQSSDTRMMMMTGMPGRSNETLSHLAFASGRVYVATNLGATAAVDAYSGATAWLTIYPREQVALDRRQMQMQMQMRSALVTDKSHETRPWELNAVIAEDGKLFTLPSDGKFIHIYDAATGDEIKRIRSEFQLKGESLRMTMLLGVMGEKLILGDKDRLFVIDWQKVAFKKNNDKVIIEDSILCRGETADIAGRPFITASSIFIPTSKRLVIMDITQPISDWRISHAFPGEGADWAEGEGPGNVLVSEGQVVMATARNVNVYADLRGVREKFQLALKANPADVEARLVFSEMMFNAREFDESASTLDDAIAALGGRESMLPGAARDRIFADAINFAQKLAREPGGRRIAQADEMFDRAEAAALTPAQQVTYRLERARFIDRASGLANGGYERIAHLYHDVVSTPELRAVMIPAGERGMRQAGRVAEDELAMLMATPKGAQMYARFEEEAAAALEKLAAAGDPDQLLALAERYPNAATAQKAMLKAAEAYEKRDNPRMATQVLRRLYWRYSARADQAQLLALSEAMARNYLRVGNTGAALGRLQRAAAEKADAPLSQPLVIGTDPLGGQTPPRTMMEAVAALQKVIQARAGEALPNLKLPPALTHDEKMDGKEPPDPFLPTTAQSVIEDVQAIVKPPVELASAGRHDRLLVWQNGKLACYAPGATTPLWTSEALDGQAAVGLAWQGKDLLVWSGLRVAILDAASGAVSWKADLKDLPTVELAAGGAVETTAAADDIQQFGNQGAVMIGGAGRLVIRGGAHLINPAGQPAVAEEPPPMVGGAEQVVHVRPLNDRIVVSTTTGRVAALKLEDGKPLWQTRLSTGNAIRQTLCSEDFTVLRLAEGTTVQLVVLDTYSGQQTLAKKFTTSHSVWPLNLTLSPDGMLVWTAPNSIFAKDLYEAGDNPSWERTGRSYANLMRPEQIVIHNQTIYALCQNGAFIDRRSLRTGDPIGNQMGAGGNETTRLLLNGPRLYAVTQAATQAYHLEEESASDMRALTKEGVALPQEAMLTQDQLVIPWTRGGQGDYVIVGYSREMVHSVTGKVMESGYMTLTHTLNEPSKIKSFQAVEGGLFYLTNNARLHWLAGSR